MTNRSIQIDISTNVRGVGETNKLTRELGQLEKQVEGLNAKSGRLANVQRTLADSFRRGIGDKLPSELSFLEEKLDAIPIKASAVAGAVGIAAGAIATIGIAAFNSAKAVADVALQYDKLAQQTGTNVEFLSLLTAVSNDLEVSTDTLNTGLIRFSANLQKVKGPTADVQTELFKVADAFAAMKDGPQKTALAMELFGRAGAGLIPVLNQGSEGLRTLMESTRALGKVIDEETLASAKRFDDAMDTLGTRLDGLKIRIGSAVLPAVTDLVVAIDEAAIKQETLSRALQQSINALNTTAQTGQITAESISSLANIALVLSNNMFQVVPSGRATSDVLGVVARASSDLSNDLLERLDPSIRNTIRALLGIPPAAATAANAMVSSAATASSAASVWSSAAAQIAAAYASIGATATGPGGRAINVRGAIEAGRIKARQINEARKAREAYLAENAAAAAAMTQQERMAAKARAMTEQYRKQYDALNAAATATKKYSTTWEELYETQEKARRGGGGGALSALDEELKAIEERTRRVAGALGDSLKPLSMNNKLQLAFSIATGELTVEQFALEQAIKAVVAANEAGALSLKQTLNAAFAASTGLASVADLYTIAGEAGQQFSAEFNEIMAALSDVPELKELEKTMKSIGDKSKLKVDIVAKVLGLQQVQEAKALQDSLKDKTVIYTVSVNYDGSRTPNIPTASDFRPPSQAQGQIRSADKPPVTVNVDVKSVSSNIDITQMAWKVAEEIRRRE